MNNWQQEIEEKLQELEATPVIRFDVEQNLTAAQKKRAPDNVSKSVSVGLISGDNYSITFF